MQQLYHYEDESGISNLKFSSAWVRGFLKRANLRRRKITTDDKKILSIKEIVAIMSIGQNLIREFGYGPDNIFVSQTVE